MRFSAAGERLESKLMASRRFFVAPDEVEEIVDDCRVDFVALESER